MLFRSSGVLRGFTIVEGTCRFDDEHTDQYIDQAIMVQVFGYVDSRPKMEHAIITSDQSKSVIQKEPITKPTDTKPTLTIPKQMTQEATDSSGATVF